MIKQHWPWGWAIVAALLVGALIGCWQGFWIAYIGIPSFIVTLSSMLVFRGVTFTVLAGRDVGQLPSAFRDRTTGFLPNYDLGFGSKLHDLTIVLGLFFSLIVVINQWRDRRVQTRYGAEALPFYLFVGKVIAIVAFLLEFTYLLAKYNGYPVVLLILAFLLLTYGFMMKRTVLGRHIYAVGGNAAAAKLSGVKSQRVTFFVFVNMGVLSALCGLLITARLNSATQSAGNFFELEAIAAAFIGGASASGGVGTVLGAVIGGLVTAVIANGLSLTSASTGRQYVVRGLLLLFAVAFDIYNKKRVGR
jgi:putative multiple sugar transport system permease protein